MTQTYKIAFLGLGVMGGPMAAYLVHQGHKVTAYNRTTHRAQKWQAALASYDLTAEIAETAADAASDADTIISCLGNDQDVEEVFLQGGGVMNAAKPGCLVIDHTTISAKMARMLYAEGKRRDIDVVDAPVSGGQAGAEAGALAIMCGGDDDAYARAVPIMEAYGKRIVHIGPSGAGQTAKMANQMCIAGTLAGLSEAIRLVQASGIDGDRVLEAISGGAAQSWQMENRWKTMMADQFDFGFAIEWMRKDLGYAIQEASDLGLESPVAYLVNHFYGSLMAAGGARQDTSALIRNLPKGHKR